MKIAGSADCNIALLKELCVIQFAVIYKHPAPTELPSPKSLVGAISFRGAKTALNLHNAKSKT